MYETGHFVEGQVVTHSSAVKMESQPQDCVIVLSSRHSRVAHPSGSVMDSVQAGGLVWVIV
jgi:hypothetical protein